MNQKTAVLLLLTAIVAVIIVTTMLTMQVAENIPSSPKSSAAATVGLTILVHDEPANIQPEQESLANQNGGIK